MKHYKCNCGRERITEDEIMMVICEGCQREMELIKIFGKEDGEEIII